MSKASLFISYSHKDDKWLELLSPHLAVLRMQGQVNAWSDRSIAAGDSWEQQIQTAMAQADVAVLLVTTNFLDSRFIMDRELPTLLEILDGRRQGRLRRILPLIVAPCMWKYVPAFKALEVRPKGHELSAGNEHHQQKDLTEFATELARLLLEPRDELAIASEPATVTSEPLILAERSYATLELRIAHREWAHYQVELGFTWSGDRKWDFVHRYGVTLDPGALGAVQDLAAYARALDRALFPDETARAELSLAKARADEKRVPLRVRVCIEHSARELHTLNWESLTVADWAEGPLASRSTSFARYTLGPGPGRRPVQVRRRTEPRALVLGVDLRGEAVLERPDRRHLDAVCASLAEAGVATVAERRWIAPESLEAALRPHDGVDCLYLGVSGWEMLGLGAPRPGCLAGGEPGERAHMVRNELLEAIAVLERLPRLVVCADASPADAGVPTPWPWLVCLSHELTEVGVLSALCLQGPLAQEDWCRFLAVFFREVKDHGQTDQATLGARAQILQSGASWAPVIVSRLRSSKLWYLPHFMDERIRESTWSLLVRKIEQGRCLPVIGAGVDYRVARFRQEVALRWADRYQYPLSTHEQASLAQVTQYVAATFGRDLLMDEFNDQLRSFALRRYGHLIDDSERRLPLDRLFSAIARASLERDPNDPHFVLASLPFRYYVTANFNNFLADALRTQGHEPQELVFSSAQSPSAIQDPDIQRPLVYHLFGRLDDEESMVLTEDDYFDFLIDYWNDRGRIPQSLRGALSGYSLLFLGFNLNHWDFRVLFRSLLKEEGRGRRRDTTHVAVQIDPDDDQITDPDRAREYLEKYFEKFAEGNVSIYWGSSEDFLSELWRRWQETQT